jgi:hypothetical protein
MKTTKNYFKPFRLIASLIVIVSAGIILEQEEFAPIPRLTAGHGHELYQCPMHPQIIQDHPGECPICHMKLEKVEGGGDEKEETSTQAKSDVPGKAGFKLSQERQQLIGVKTTAAELKPLLLTVRMPGRVSPGGEVLAQLLEIDAGSVKRGMKARLRGPGGDEIEARVLDVDGNLDSLTRSFGVVLQASTYPSWLKQGVFCEVLVEASLGKHLAVPSEAILDTGDRQVLFIADSKGHFEPRQVILGQAGDDWTEVKSGLKAGDQVVTSANFLIDSESRFQAALKQL